MGLQVRPGKEILAHIQSLSVNLEQVRFNRAELRFWCREKHHGIRLGLENHLWHCS